ncbi:uncharacterized protein METZ01_LOCUS451756, partial [marine metagenome]
ILSLMVTENHSNATKMRLMPIGWNETNELILCWSKTD